MLLAILPLTSMKAHAACTETLYTGTSQWNCGSSVRAHLHADGTLHIYGNGATYQYVNSTGQPWSSYKSNITSVIIDSGVTSIGNYLFNKYTGITSITIPDTVTSIGDEAFTYCTGLTSLTIPSSVTTMPTRLCAECTSLASVSLPNTLTTIKNGDFRNCTSLTNIIIPDSVTTIEYGAFIGCTGLTSVTVHDNVTSIAGAAFSGCSSLASFTIPSNITTIESNTFEKCSSLTSITIPSGVTSIGDSAFSESGLTSITIPNNVTSIGKKAFYKTTGLTGSVTIPSGVTSIGESTFEQSGLTSITLPDTVTSIGSSAFRTSKLTSITIPSSVTSIGSYAFCACYDIGSVVLKGTSITIGSVAFGAVGRTSSGTPRSPLPSLSLPSGWAGTAYTNSTTPWYGGYFDEAVDISTIVSSVDITGTPQVGQTVTANVTFVGTQYPVSYQWYRDTEAIAGATSNTYTLTADDDNTSVKVRVTSAGYVNYVEGSVNVGTPVVAASASNNHTHEYRWETVSEATADHDGLEQYRCECGDVKDSSVIPSSVYVVNGLYDVVNNAPQNGSVKFNSDRLYCITDYIIKKLDERNDVSTEITFIYGNNTYKMTIPAGRNYKKLLSDQDYFYGYFGFASFVPGVKIVKVD